HPAAEDLTRQDSTQQVQIEHVAQRVFRQVEEAQVWTSGGLRDVAAGAVDQAVYAPEFVERGPRGVSQRLLFERVADDDRRASGAGEPINRRLALLAAPREDRDVGAAPDQRARHRAAQDAGGAGDDYRAAREIVHLQQSV